MARYSPDPKDGGFAAWNALIVDENGEKEASVFFGFSAELNPRRIAVVDEERQYVDVYAEDINGDLIIAYDELVTYRIHGPVLVVTKNDEEAKRKITEFFQKNKIVKEPGKPPCFGDGATVIYVGEDPGE